MTLLHLVQESTEPTNYDYLKLGRQVLPTLPRGSEKRRIYLQAEADGIIDKWGLMRELVDMHIEPFLLNRVQLHVGKSIYYGDSND